MTVHSEVAPSHVNAGPTKAFFVSMITRDIELVPAIIDLIDNSVDGARSLRARDRLDGLYVKLTFTPEQFTIEDNCGGIDIDVARDRAFRFGRPSGTAGVAHSVGQFGVGMKRALFKLGSEFNVDSRTEGSEFSLDVNVLEWEAVRDPDWGFEFSSFDDDASYSLEETGTRLSVTALHAGVRADFALETFASGLIADIESKHRISIAKGLAVSVNGHVLRATQPAVISSEDIRPARRELQYAGPRGGSVDVVLVAGLAEPDPPEDPGWYIYCNDRLVLGPDTTSTTVWGEGRGRTIPRYHTQFSRFRGFAFFDSDLPSDLPWTTIKVGVEGTSPVWRATRREMLTCTRGVIDFLNLLHWEHPQIEDGETGELEVLVEQAAPAEASSLSGDSLFSAPSREGLTPPPDTTSIQYRLSAALVDEAKELLGVTTNRDVGLQTFEYFMDAEG